MSDIYAFGGTAAFLLTRNYLTPILSPLSYLYMYVYLGITEGWRCKKSFENVWKIFCHTKKFRYLMYLQATLTQY